MPEGWAVARMGTYITFTGGAQPPKETFEYSPNEDNIRLIQIRDYKTDAYATYIPKKLARRFCSKTDVMIGRYGPPLFQILRGIEGAYNVAIMKAEAVPEIMQNDYLYYMLQDGTLLHFLESLSDRTCGQDGVNMFELNNYLILIPPYDEQRRIIKKLEETFPIIESLKENISDLTAAIKQAKSKILDLAIHGKLVPQDPNDEPAEELLKRIATSDNRPYEKVESSEIDWTLPNNWCLCHFGDIATVINGKNQSKVENPNGKYPIYGSGGIMGRADDYICPENCTIIGRKGSINNPIFVEEKFWNVDTAFGLSPSEVVLPKFLFYFCEYFDFTTLDSSTTLPSLTKTNIQQIVFALPPIEEQKRILDKTNELFGKLDEIVLNLI